MKIKKLIKASLIVFSIYLIFAACQWETIEPVKIDTNVGDTVSFAKDLQPIFTSNCITCHVSRNPVLTEGHAYSSLTTGGFVNTSNPPSSIIIVQLTNVHIGFVTPSQKALILKWIQQGALNN